MEITTVGDFIDVVEKMREAQKKYFRTRQGLDDCKMLEKTVDDALKKRNEKKKDAGQLNLL